MWTREEESEQCNTAQGPAVRAFTPPSPQERSGVTGHQYLTCDPPLPQEGGLKSKGQTHRNAANKHGSTINYRGVWGWGWGGAVGTYTRMQRVMLNDWEGKGRRVISPTCFHSQHVTHLMQLPVTASSVNINDIPGGFIVTPSKLHQRASKFPNSGGKKERTRSRFLIRKKQSNAWKYLNSRPCSFYC